MHFVCVYVCMCACVCEACVYVGRERERTSETPLRLIFVALCPLCAQFVN